MILNDRMQEYIEVIDKKDLPTSINTQKMIRDLSYLIDIYVLYLKMKFMIF